MYSFKPKALKEFPSGYKTSSVFPEVFPNPFRSAVVRSVGPILAMGSPQVEFGGVFFMLGVYGYMLVKLWVCFRQVKFIERDFVDEG